MPILDSENYSLSGIAPAMAVLKNILIEGGKDPEKTPVSLLNIYCGVSAIEREDTTPWHVCYEREYGQLYVVFHQIEHGSVVKTSVPDLAVSLGLCITLCWTSDEPTAEQVKDAVSTADQIIQTVELATGKPLPIPLKPMQLPDRFTIKTVDPRRKKTEAVRTKVILPKNKPILIPAEDNLILAVGALTGAFGPSLEMPRDEMTEAIKVSATWQRRAIRALGVEEWPDAVIASNVWLETFMVRLADILNKANGKPLKNVQALMMRGGLVKFVNTHLGQPFLKGHWDHTRDDTIFGAWCKKCFRVRNEIVHAGRLVGDAEARSAYETSHQLVKEITRRAASIKDPKLAPILRPLTSTHDTLTREKS